MSFLVINFYLFQFSGLVTQYCTTMDCTVNFKPLLLIFSQQYICFKMEA